MKQTLEGVRDIGLIVKYGQVNGLPEAMRPTILLMLQDRARDLLRHGEVPLLQSTDEADMVGRPRLVFTITLNEQTATAPAIFVEGRLFQRVRLWRDPTKEMELATLRWSLLENRIGTQQALFVLFEKVVGAFVKAYREANPNSTDAPSRTPDPAGQVKPNTNSLQGLNCIDPLISLSNHVVNGRRNELLSSDDHYRKLSNVLPREAESRLKQARIPLSRSYNDSERAGWPLLHVTITLSPPDSYVPAIQIRSELWQRVRTLRDSRKVYTVTWESRASESGPTTDEAVRRVLNSQLDEFIKAYNAANPQLSSAPK